MMFDTPQEFLRWVLSADGLAAVISFLLVTFVPDLFGRSWEELIPPRWRRMAFAGVSLVTVAVAMVLLRLAFGTPLDVSLVWNALVSVFIVYFGGSQLTGARKLPSTAAWRGLAAGRRVGGVDAKWTG